MPRRKNKLNKNTPQLINIVFTGILSKIKNRWKRNLLFFRKKYFQESGQLGYDGSRGMSSQNFRRAQGAKRKRGSCTADTDFIKMVAFIIYLFFSCPLLLSDMLHNATALFSKPTVRTTSCSCPLSNAEPKPANRHTPNKI